MAWERFIFSGKRPQSLVQASRVNPSTLAHPNEKPVPLMEHIVGHYCPEGGIVLDPFTGVSPVAIAAQNTGRKWICIEKEEKYCEVAATRIQQCEIQILKKVQEDPKEAKIN